MKGQGIAGPWDNPDVDVERVGTPDHLMTTRVDVRDQIDQKLQAFQAHQTQFSPQRFMYKLPEEEFKQFFGYEYFQLAHRALAGHTGDLEQDAFDGLGGK